MPANYWVVSEYIHSHSKKGLWISKEGMKLNRNFQIIGTLVKLSFYDNEKENLYNVFSAFFGIIFIIGHIRQDTLEKPICSDFLRGKCKKGSTCRKHHCPLPFHWLYFGGGNWRSFTEEDNEKIEKVYCDEKLDECSVADVNISFERQVLFKNIDLTIIIHLSLISIRLIEVKAVKGLILVVVDALTLVTWLTPKELWGTSGGLVVPSTEPFQSLKIWSIVSC